MISTVINLYGGPGTGKSTCASGLFTLLKMHGINCEIAPEFAKDLTWENRTKTLQNQRYIFGKQYHRLWRLDGEVEIIITDSPLLFSLYYKPKYYPTSFVHEVLSAREEFHNFDYYLQRVKPYNPKGRSQTEEEAKKIDSDLIDILKIHRVRFNTIPGNYEGINMIAIDILTFLKKEVIIQFDKKKTV